jgi:methylglutaconyl-CoA hydratase
MAVATPDATFAFSEVRLGLTPATISPYVVAAIGPAARPRAVRHRRPFRRPVRPRDRPGERRGRQHRRGARTHRRRDAGLCAGAVAEAKRLVDYVQGRSIDRGLMEETARRIASQRASEEGREGLAAFLERRRPSWTQ